MSKSAIKSIVIKDGITSIASGAFTSCENLTSITIPDSVTEIGGSAFSQCGNLKSMVIPNSVTSIGLGAFSLCYALTDVTLPDKLTTIESCLLDNTSLSSISIPPAVTSIGGSAFAHTNLYSVTIPDGVTTLRESAFSSCKNLTTVYIPASVTTMGSSVFNSCTSLKDVYFGGTKKQLDAIEASVNTSIFVNCGKNYTIHYESYNPPGTSTPEPPARPSFKERLQQFLENLTKRFHGITTICCPVDVEIFAGGQSVGKIVNNVASGVDEDKIFVYVEDDEKYICFLTTEEFTINLTATGTGTMEYSVQNMDVASWITLDEKQFQQVGLTPGKEMASYITYLDAELVDTPNTQLYVLADGEPVRRVLPDGQGTEVPLGVQLITFDANGGAVTSSIVRTEADGTLSELPVPTRGGYTFNGWYTAAGGGTEITKETVFTEDTTVYAHWTKEETPPEPDPETCIITVEASPADGGNVTGSDTYIKGASVTVTATANSGYRFVRWMENDQQVSTDASYTFTVEADRTLTAVFNSSAAAKIGNKFYATVQDAVNIVKVNETIELTGTATEAELGALRAPVTSQDSEFVFYITGPGVDKIKFIDTVSDGYIYHAVIDANGKVTVTRTGPLTKISVTVAARPTTGGTVTGGGSYGEGESVTVKAVANSGYRFVRWTENGQQVSTSATYTFKAEANRTLTAEFVWIGSGGYGPTPSNPSYQITVSNTAGGTVTPNAATAKKGDTVTLTSKASAGYISAAPTVKDKDGKTVTVVKIANGTWSFTMPEGGVTVTGNYMTPAQMFSDVDDSKWYRNDLAFAVEHGLIQGNAGKFNPETALTRGMMVTLLYNLEVSLEGKPTAPSATFNDVQTGQYYTDAVAWASYNRIVEGYNKNFNPNGVLDRQQMATMLYRYAAYKGYNVNAAADLSGYTDAGSIASWALAGMHWANSAGIVTGSNSALDPTGISSRTMGAVLLAKFCRQVVGME